MAFLFFSSRPLFATELANPGTPARKFQRGLINIALSPIEISHELKKEKYRDTWPPSWLLGLGRGTFFGMGRILVGAYEVVSFPLPGYDPVLQPEFPYEHFPVEQPEPAKAGIQ